MVELVVPVALLAVIGWCCAIRSALKARDRGRAYSDLLGIYEREWRRTRAR